MEMFEASGHDPRNAKIPTRKENRVDLKSSDSVSTPFEFPGIIIPPPSTTLGDLRTRLMSDANGRYRLDVERIVDATKLPLLRNLDPIKLASTLSEPDVHGVSAGTYSFESLAKVTEIKLAQEIVNESRSIEWRREALGRLFQSIYDGKIDLAAQFGTPNAAEAFTLRNPPLLSRPDEFQPALSVTLDAGSLEDWLAGYHTIRFDFQPHKSSADLPNIFLIHHEEEDQNVTVFLRLLNYLRARDISMEEIWGGNPKDLKAATEELATDIVDNGLAWAVKNFGDKGNSVSFDSAREAKTECSMPKALEIEQIEVTAPEPYSPSQLELPMPQLRVRKAYDSKKKLHLEIAIRDPDESQIISGSETRIRIPISSWSILRPKSANTILQNASSEGLAAIVERELPELLRLRGTKIDQWRYGPLEGSPLEYLLGCVLREKLGGGDREAVMRYPALPQTTEEVLRSKLSRVTEYMFAEAPEGAHPAEWLILSMNMDLRGATRFDVMNGLGHRMSGSLPAPQPEDCNEFLNRVGEVIDEFRSDPKEGLERLFDQGCNLAEVTPKAIPILSEQRDSYNLIGDIMLARVGRTDSEKIHRDAILRPEYLRYRADGALDFYLPVTSADNRTSWLKAVVFEDRVVELFATEGRRTWGGNLYGASITIKHVSNPVDFISEVTDEMLRGKKSSARSNSFLTNSLEQAHIPHQLAMLVDPHLVSLTKSFRP